MAITLPTPPLRRFVSNRPTTTSAVVNFVWDAEPFRSLTSRPKVHTCSGCRHWEKLDELESESAGLCKFFALAPNFNAWPITEKADWCADWSSPEEQPSEQDLQTRE